MEVVISLIREKFLYLINWLFLIKKMIKILVSIKKKNRVLLTQNNPLITKKNI